MTYPYSGGEDNKDSVEDNQDGQKAQKKEPEPEKYVNLLIHCRKVKLLAYNFNYLSCHQFLTWSSFLFTLGLGFRHVFVCFYCCSSVCDDANWTQASTPHLHFIAATPRLPDRDTDTGN